MTVECQVSGFIRGTSELRTARASCDRLDSQRQAGALGPRISSDGTVERVPVEKSDGSTVVPRYDLRWVGSSAH